MYMQQHVCGGQRTISGSQFSPSTRWVRGLKLGSSGEATRTLTH